MADNSNYYVIRAGQLRWLALLVLVAAVAAVAFSGALADNAGEALYNTGDGRINVVHHFGGDALYCVDGDFVPTNTLFAEENEGGFQLLNMNGERLWFVPAATVLEKMNAVQPGGDRLLVAEGQGSYGMTAIYVYKMTDGTVRFIFTGIDEHGKSSQMDFEGCQPVYPPTSKTQGQSLCTLNEVNEALLNEDVAAFQQCFNQVCPPASFDGILPYKCFCAQYPSSLVCQQPN